MLFDTLRQVHPDAPQTRVFLSPEEALAFYQSSLQDDTSDSTTFFFLFNAETKQICAICDYGMYEPSPADFLFRTPYVPFQCSPDSAGGISLSAIEAVVRLEHDVSCMQAVASYPLFLTEWIGYNDYLAWSLTENKEMLVSGFKAGEDDFRVADMSASGWGEPKQDSKYTVFPPDKEDIRLFGLRLDPSTWNGLNSWDEWKEKNERKESETVFEPYREYYREAIRLANLNRARNLGSQEGFAKLERSLDRFEEMQTHFNGPNSMLDQCYSSLKRHALEMSGSIAAAK